VIHPHLSWDATDLAVPLPLQPPPPTFLTDEEPAFDEAAFPLPERRGRMEQAQPPSRPRTPTQEESEYKTQQTYTKEPQQERPRQVPPLQLALSPDLKKLLASQGLSSLESSLVSEGVLSLHQLAYVSEADLERLGLNMGQRAGLRSQLAQRGFDVSKSIQSSSSAPAAPSAEEQGAVTKSTASSRAHQRSKFSGPASSRAFSPRGASARSTGSSTGRRRQEDVGPARPRPTAKQSASNNAHSWLR
jgi:predicted flap endonuclease-1-like 5' DNA nuclease